jgi:VanZ family protein
VTKQSLVIGKYQMIFLRYWLPLVTYALGIFGLSSIPGDGLPPMPLDISFLPEFIANNPDKIAHALMYGILGWLSLRAVARGANVAFPLAAILAFFIASTYGATDEFHQMFVPKRSSTVGDWVADSVGSFLAIAILYPIYSGRKSPQDSPSDVGA